MDNEVYNQVLRKKERKKPYVLLTVIVINLIIASVLITLYIKNNQDTISIKNCIKHVCSNSSADSKKKLNFCFFVNFLIFEI